MKHECLTHHCAGKKSLRDLSLIHSLSRCVALTDSLNSRDPQGSWHELSDVTCQLCHKGSFRAKAKEVRGSLVRSLAVMMCVLFAHK